MGLLHVLGTFQRGSQSLRMGLEMKAAGLIKAILTKLFPTVMGHITI